MKDPIYIKHSIESCNINQAVLLSKLKDPKLIALFTYQFNSGNADYRYHLLSNNQKVTPELHEMWLEGLEKPMKSGFTKRGFEENKATRSFTRFVMEMADVGLDEFMMSHLNEEDWKTHQNLRNSKPS